MTRNCRNLRRSYPCSYYPVIATGLLAAVTVGVWIWHLVDMQGLQSQNTSVRGFEFTEFENTLSGSIKCATFSNTTLPHFPNGTPADMYNDCQENLEKLKPINLLCYLAGKIPCKTVEVGVKILNPGLMSSHAWLLTFTLLTAGSAMLSLFSLNCPNDSQNSYRELNA